MIMFRFKVSLMFRVRFRVRLLDRMTIKTLKRLVNLNAYAKIQLKLGIKSLLKFSPQKIIDFKNKDFFHSFQCIKFKISGDHPRQTFRT